MNKDFTSLPVLKNTEKKKLISEVCFSEVKSYKLPLCVSAPALNASLTLAVAWKSITFIRSRLVLLLYILETQGEMQIHISVEKKTSWEMLSMFEVNTT